MTTTPPPPTRAARPAPLPPLPPPAAMLLAWLPTAIAVLWFAGVIRSHGFELPLADLLGIAAIAVGMHLLLRRLVGRKPPLPLPSGTSVARASLRSAALVTAVVIVIGTGIEFTAPLGDATPPAPLWLRALWHVTCGFAAAYCRFLSRYRAAPARPR